MPDPKSFEITGWQELIKPLLTKGVGDSGLPAKLVQAKASHDASFNVGPLVFSIQPDAQASIVVINSKDDLDNDAVQGAVSFAASDDVPPPLNFTEKGAWLGYDITASVKADGGGSLAGVGLNIDGEKTIQFFDCHFHADRSQPLREAIVADLQSIRFAVRSGDIEKLGDNDAVCYGLRGKLATTIEGSWADALTANLNRLSSFLQTNTPVAIKINLGADFKLAAEIVDDFQLILAREKEGRIRLGVRKSKVSSRSAAASAGVSVNFINPGAITDAVNAVLEGLSGAAVAKVNSLLEQTVLTALNDEQRALFNQLVHRFKLDEHLADLGGLKQHWDKLTGQVQEQLETAVKEKFAAGFSYEYSRVRSESTLLQLVLPQDALLASGNDLHGSLIRGNLNPTLQWCRDNKVAPEKYLHESRLSTDRKWGLSISLGKKFRIGGTDIEKLEDITREDGLDRRQITFLGQRGYEGNWVGQKVTWMADFSADMKDFADNPRMSDVDFGLHFKWDWDEKKLSNDEASTYIDYAEIWRAVSDSRSARAELAPHVGKKAAISLELKIDDDGFRELVKAAAATTADHIAFAMAKAMPWAEFEARSIVERRRRLYAPLWKTYLNDPGQNYRDYAASAKKILQQLENGAEVAILEGAIPSGVAQTAWPVSFAEMIRLNGTQAGGGLSGIAEDWQRFRASIKTLADAFAVNDSPNNLRKVFKDFCGLWSQSLQLRAVGAFWIDLAAANNLLGHVERSLTVTIPDDKVHLNLGLPA